VASCSPSSPSTVRRWTVSEDFPLYIVVVLIAFMLLLVVAQ